MPQNQRLINMWAKTKHIIYGVIDMSNSAIAGVLLATVIGVTAPSIGVAESSLEQQAVEVEVPASESWTEQWKSKAAISLEKLKVGSTAVIDRFSNSGEREQKLMKDNEDLRAKIIQLQDQVRRNNLQAGLRHAEVTSCAVMVVDYLKEQEVTPDE